MITSSAMASPKSSAEQIFLRVEQIRTRALAILQGKASPDAPEQAEGLTGQGSIELRLPALAQQFELSALEVDALLCLIAAEYEPIVRTLERALQRELGRPWLELGTLAELLGLPAERVPALARALAPDAPLRAWALVHTDDPSGTEVPAVFTRVKIATRVAQYLIGQDLLPDGIAVHSPARPLLASSLVPEAAHAGIVQRLRRAQRLKEGLVVEIVGVAGTGRRAFAEGLAHALDQPLVIADLAEPGRYDDRNVQRLDERIAVARREAAIQGALLALIGWMPPPVEARDDGSGNAPQEPVRKLPRAVERLILDSSDVLFLVAEERETLLARVATTVVHVAVPFPTPSQRALLLEATISELGGRIDPQIDTNGLTRRFALDPMRIEVASRAAVESARERLPAGDERPEVEVNATDIQEACRHQLRHDLKSLAQRVTNSHKWSDLVIPVDVYHSLKEMSSYVRNAERVYDEWGFGARHSLAQGVSALFAGPPGTGKTMCASVMARELDMELFRVDLSRIVSKWIGETEKNLGKVFDEADRSNAIILFDEADALFAKRTEVKSSVDRYANLEINFLLQRMEAFGGVTILTTNFEDTIDTAFKRRLTFRMRFEKPDADARGALWRKIFPRDAKLAPDLDHVQLGAMYELAGGNIRNAALRAAFIAAEAGTAIDQRTCMIAAEREAREMGLLVRSQIPNSGELPSDVRQPTHVVTPETEAEPERTAAELPSGARSRIMPVTRPRRTS